MKYFFHCEDKHRVAFLYRVQDKMNFQRAATNYLLSLNLIIMPLFCTIALEQANWTVIVAL